MALEQIIQEKGYPRLQEQKEAQERLQQENKKSYNKYYFKDIEPLLYALPNGNYILKDRDNNLYAVKKTEKNPSKGQKDRDQKDSYGRLIPVVEIEPLRDSMPLKRDQIPYGIRGFCFPATGASYVHIDDVDTYRVNYHENLHIRIYRTNPNHPEWEIRMLEDWRLGEEKRN